MTDPDLIALLVALAECPDCNSDAELAPEPGHPGLTRLLIRHDDTCPRYQRMRAEGRAR